MTGVIFMAGFLVIALCVAGIAIGDHRPLLSRTDDGEPPENEGAVAQQHH